MLRKSIITTCIVGFGASVLPLVVFPRDKALRISWMNSDPAYEWINQHPDYRTDYTMQVGMKKYWAIGKAKGRLEVWRYGFARPGALSFLIRIPIREIAMLCGVVGGYLVAIPYLRRYRRRKLGLCVECTYDLTGNTSGVCPECGTPVEAEPRGGDVRDS